MTKGADMAESKDSTTGFNLKAGTDFKGDDARPLKDALRDDATEGEKAQLVGSDYPDNYVGVTSNGKPLALSTVRGDRSS